MHWLVGVIGALFSSLALLMLALELLVERHKAAAERDWGNTLRRSGSEAGRLGFGGALLILLAIFMVDPDTGFRVFVVPLGVVGATAPLIHLVASWRAAREEPPKSETWQRVADRSGQVMMSCSYLLVIACTLYAFVTMGSKLDGLAQRVAALEEKQQASGE